LVHEVSKLVIQKSDDWKEMDYIRQQLLPRHIERLAEVFRRSILITLRLKILKRIGNF